MEQEPRPVLLAAAQDMMILHAFERNFGKARMPIDVAVRSSSPIPRIAAVVLAAGIFAIDTFTPLGIAIAVLYAIVIFLTASFLDRRGIMIVAALCAAFTLISFYLGHRNTLDPNAAIRCAISLSAILLTAFLAIRNHEATLRLKSQAALLDLTHDAIFVRGSDGTLTYWNRGAEKLYGWSAEEAVGRKAAELLRARFCVEPAPGNPEFLRSGRWEGEVLHARRDGTEVVVASRWSLYRDPHGKPVATMETNSDITDRHQVEEALHRTRDELSHVARVTTLGELAASIAHEVNQPLAAIVTNGQAGLRWLDRDVPNLEAVRASLEKMIGNGRRASDVIARLRALARRTDMEHEPVDLNEAVEETLLLVQRELADRGADLQLSLEPVLPKIVGDKVQLQQVTINLIVNALQAMEGIANRQRQLRIATRREKEESGDNVVLEIADTGVGIDPEKAGSLFTAFYSTKENGMGMGLSICRAIVEAHHGQISASRNDGPGATFSVRLPALSSEAS